MGSTYFHKKFYLLYLKSVVIFFNSIFKHLASDIIVFLESSLRELSYLGRQLTRPTTFVPAKGSNTVSPSSVVISIGTTGKTALMIAG